MKLSIPGRKATRTLLQALASGAFTGFFAVDVLDLPPKWAYLLPAIGTALMTLAQNKSEEAGVIPTILPTTTEPSPPAEALPLVRRKGA